MPVLFPFNRLWFHLIQVINWLSISGKIFQRESKLVNSGVLGQVRLGGDHPVQPCAQTGSAGAGCPGLCPVLDTSRSGDSTATLGKLF